MFAPKPKLIALAAAGALAVAGASHAGADAPAGAAKVSAEPPARTGIVESPDDRFDRAPVVAHYRVADAKARNAGLAPTDNLAEGKPVAGDRLLNATPALRSAVRDRAPAPTAAAGSVTGSPDTLGVSQATLDAIASCESGGDPTAVSADGPYRGLYQFDEGTWASVGGSGDPAAAPVAAEQDMRAAMLYARVGASAWPVCGQ